MTDIKKVIYTCITGAYEDACAHVYIDDTWDYVMFTDNPYLLGLRRYTHWQIRPLAFNKLTNVKNARWHKINAHKLFPNYDISLWVDGNIVIMKPEFFHRINKFIMRKDKVCIPLHPERTCIYDEADTIKKLKLDNKSTVDKEMSVLSRSGYPRNIGLNETGIMLRRHNDTAVQHMQRRWWYMVKNYSRRDQLSYNWVAWRCGIKTTPMFDSPGAHRKSDELLFVYSPTHNQNPAQNFNVKTLPHWLVKSIAALIVGRKRKQYFIKKYSR